MEWSQALWVLKEGGRVARSGWNGKGMWLAMVGPADWYLINPRIESLGLKKLPFILMKTADGGLVPWLASQTDQLAEDWERVP